MKKLILAAVILSTSGAAFAAGNGFYLGGQAGWANTGDTVSLGDGSSETNNVVAGGVNVGYQFSPNIAIQGDYTKLANSKSSINFQPFGSLNGTLKTQIVDIVGKVIYPIPNSGFSVYGKAGAAYVDDTYDLSLNTPLASGSISSSTHPIRPEVGAGVSYDIDQNVSANIDYTFIAKNNTIDNINAVMFGLTYHFA